MAARIAWSKLTAGSPSLALAFCRIVVMLAWDHSGRVALMIVASRSPCDLVRIISVFFSSADLKQQAFFSCALSYVPICCFSWLIFLTEPTTW